MRLLCGTPSSIHGLTCKNVRSECTTIWDEGESSDLLALRAPLYAIEEDTVRITVGTVDESSN